MSFTGIIKNCRDSHVHWLATGQSLSRLNLNNLKTSSEIEFTETNKNHFLGDWLIGFGWDDNLWPKNDKPTRQALDRIFPNFPVALTRADGHALWVNSEALRRANLLNQIDIKIEGGLIPRDKSGLPTGLLVDLACELIFAIIPQNSSQSIKENLLRGMDIFNQAGFTHIRDMTCSSAQWEQEVLLEETGKLTLAVEQYFNVTQPAEYVKALNLACKAARVKYKNIRVSGLKVYFDGALGSEGALLSKCYCGKTHRGIQIMSCELLEEIMIKTWESNLELAVHAIGDEATHLVVNTALGVWNKLDRGVLHIEHAEVVRQETIGLMKGSRIVCHMQPCHWLSDKKFLKDKIGDLIEHAFPFELMQKENIKFDFGSDSPIERPSIVDNIKAINELNVKNVDVRALHSFGDDSWTQDTYTEFIKGVISKVVFRGNQLLPRLSS